MSTRLYAKPSAVQNSGGLVLRRVGANSVFLKNETSKQAKNEFPQPKAVNHDIDDNLPFQVYESEETKAALRNGSVLSQIRFFKTLVFLILSAFFSILSALGLKKYWTSSIAVVLFTLSLLNFLNELSVINSTISNAIYENIIEALLHIKRDLYCLAIVIVTFLALNYLTPQFALVKPFSVFTVIYCSLFGILYYTSESKINGLRKYFNCKKQSKTAKNNKKESDRVPYELNIKKFCERGDIYSFDSFDGSDNTIMSKESALNNYRPFVVSDRASSISQSYISISQNASWDQQAQETLRELGITKEYPQYLMNFKAFISKTILKKLVRQLSSNSMQVEMMVSLPSYENYRSYVIERITALSESLSGHFGDKGDRFKDKEWNKEMPSDNQIVMHIFSLWISFFMMHNKLDERIDNQFKFKYLSQSKEPSLGKSKYLICFDDWSRFYILAYKEKDSKEIQRYWAPPGRDSMYAALTIFFYLIKTRESNVLDAADLQDNPIYMDRVFSLTRFQ